MLSLIEFQNRFPDEDACFNYLIQKRWSGGFSCPRCGHDHAYQLKRRKLLQCANCRYQASVTAGTIFHRMRIPLLKIFWACYWISTCKKGISSKEIQRKLQVSYQTAWTLSHKIRKAMKSSGQFLITNSVELDETALGFIPDKKKEKRARIKIVVEINDNKIYRVYMEHLQSGHAATVKKFMHKYVQKGVKVKTDGATNFKFLKKEYDHQPHKMYVKADNDKHLPNVHIMIANLKTWLRGTFNFMPHKNAQRFLDEFCFRFNRRNRLDSIFDTLLYKALNSQTVTYAELIG
jgi:hypothetical protein